MTKAQRRVAIAKDALKQLMAKKFIASHGTYCKFIEPYDKDDSIRREQNAKLFQLFAKKTPCQVCQLGALFVSKVRLENKFSPNDGGMGYVRSEFMGYLSEVFESKQIGLMESAFEYDNCFAFASGVSVKNSNLAANMYLDLRGKQRMKLILENIIKNKGTFVVEEA